MRRVRCVGCHSDAQQSTFNVGWALSDFKQMLPPEPTHSIFTSYELDKSDAADTAATSPLPSPSSQA